ncbi:MAG: FadD3 family acyl-CoA ligase [Nevskiales bacterium]
MNRREAGGGRREARTAVQSAPTVPAAFLEAVTHYASRTAVIAEDGQSWSYAELDRLRQQAAQALLAFGIQPGDRVAIWAQNCAEWIVTGLAIHSIGAVLVPVNTRMRGNEAGYVLEKSGARMLFCTGNFLNQHYPTLLAAHRPPTLEQIVVMRDAQPADFGWQDFLQRAAQVPVAEVARRSAAVTPEDRMDIMFTSGTTGLPKGVVTHHRQNLRVIADWSKAMGLVPEDRYLIANPFFHAFGYKVGWLGGLLAGLTVLPHAIFDAGAILQRIARERISVLPGPPTLFISLLNDPGRAQTDLSSLRATITGAAAIAPSLIERIRAELGFRIVLTGYGLTETCGVVSLCDPGDDAETIALTSGKAIADVEVRCVDAEGQALPPGRAGEIVVRGYNVMQAYLDDPAATREAIDAEGWLHTGDIGVLDERGYVRITDRLKDMYIAGGFNCYPAEIERMLAAHPAIAQVAVIGVADERLGEVGKAYVVLRPGATLDEKTLIAWCREHMSNYKVPRFVEFMSALPTNPSGKVLKYQLRARQIHPSG